MFCLRSDKKLQYFATNNLFIQGSEKRTTKHQYKEGQLDGFHLA